MYTVVLLVLLDLPLSVVLLSVDLSMRLVFAARAGLRRSFWAARALTISQPSDTIIMPPHTYHHHRYPLPSFHQYQPCSITGQDHCPYPTTTHPPSAQHSHPLFSHPRPSPCHSPIPAISPFSLSTSRRVCGSRNRKPYLHPQIRMGMMGGPRPKKEPA